MGLFKKILRRDLTPEEQERKSRQEREWAEKCYQKGEKFAEYLKLDDKVEKLNEFGNKYPKTFFGIAGAVLAVCIVFNFWLAGSTSSTQEELEGVAKMELPTYNDGYAAPINRQITAIVSELETLDRNIKRILEKDSLTHNDSLQVREWLTRAHSLASALDAENAPVSIDADSIPASTVNKQEMQREFPAIGGK